MSEGWRSQAKERNAKILKVEVSFSRLRELALGGIAMPSDLLIEPDTGADIPASSGKLGC